ncbi:unnamed protein product, partial [Ranitomeya imitator]
EGATGKIEYEQTALRSLRPQDQLLREKFLNENGYSQTLTVKSLQGPSTKDFLKIFAFIYSFICPNYELPDSKFEEEIPKVFKELGYPFALSKSSMYTVGAPHTWPQIVAALVWLLDCIKLSIVLTKDEHVFEEPQTSEPSDEGIDFNKLFLDYTARCYEQFMDGRDTFEEIDSEVYSRLKDMYAVEESQVESLQAEIRRLMEEIERLEKDKEREPDRLASMRKLKVFPPSRHPEIPELPDGDGVSLLLTGKASPQPERGAGGRRRTCGLKNVLAHQKYSVADIERIKYEENELQETISKLSKELDEDKQHLWSEELKYAKIKESVETQVAEFHKVARKLRLIPSSAENANGHDFQIECNLDGEQHGLNVCRKQDQPPPAGAANKDRRAGHSATNKNMEADEVLEQLNSLIGEKRNDVKILKEEAQKLDELLAKKAEEADEEEKRWTEEIKSLEKHRHLLESGVNKSLEEAMKDLEKAQQELQLVEHQTEEQMRHMESKLVRVVNAVASHMGTIEKHIEEKRLQTERQYEEFNREDPLRDLRELVAKYKEAAKALHAAPGV